MAPGVKQFWGRICAGSISSHLDVLLGDEPGPVRQQLVDLIEVPEFLGGTVQPPQPCGVAPHLQELPHVQAHQVGAAVPGCCLQGELAVSLPGPPPATNPSRSPGRERTRPTLLLEGFPKDTSSRWGDFPPSLSMPVPRAPGGKV